MGTSQLISRSLSLGAVTEACCVCSLQWPTVLLSVFIVYSFTRHVTLRCDRGNQCYLCVSFVCVFICTIAQQQIHPGAGVLGSGLTRGLATLLPGYPGAFSGQIRGWKTPKRIPCQCSASVCSGGALLGNLGISRSMEHERYIIENCVYFFFCLVCLCCYVFSPIPTGYKFHMPMARYSLFVQKMPLNTDKPN